MGPGGDAGSAWALCTCGKERAGKGGTEEGRLEVRCCVLVWVDGWDSAALGGGAT